MNQLYVLRHGIAVPHGTPDIADDDRPLTHEGEEKVRQIGKGLRRLGLKLDRIVSSPLPRALRTAELVAGEWGSTALLETTDALRPDRDAAAIRAWLGTREEARLMIVGHNPAFSALIGLLVTGQPGLPLCELRKGGIAALRAEPDQGMRLDWLARPRLLRRR